jgi:lysine decarboxylase
MDRTLNALREIAASADVSAADAEHRKAYHVPAAGKLFDVPRDKEFVALDDADGKICAGSIIPYPPGIPFVCPGEQITADIIRYIKAMRNDGEKVIGVNDKGEVLVGK